MVHGNRSIAEKITLGKPVKTTLMSLSNLAQRDGEMAEEAKTILQAFNSWDKKEQAHIQSINKTSLVKSYLKMDAYCKTFAGMEQYKLFAQDLNALKKNKLLMSTMNYYKQIQTCHALENGATKSRRVKSLLSSIKNFISTKKPTGLLESDLEKMIQDLESL